MYMYNIHVYIYIMYSKFGVYIYILCIHDPLCLRIRPRGQLPELRPPAPAPLEVAAERSGPGEFPGSGLGFRV